MASPLVGAIRKQVAAGFKGKLTKGSLRRELPGGVDEFGDPLPGTVTNYPFEGIRDSFSALYREQAGIPETDVAILVLLGSTSVTPKQNDKLFLDAPWNKWHQCRKILEIDPAGASAKLQAFEIEALE